jgi:hypothetical protein
MDPDAEQSQIQNGAAEPPRVPYPLIGCISLRPRALNLNAKSCQAVACVVHSGSILVHYSVFEYHSAISRLCKVELYCVIYATYNENDKMKETE